MLDRTEYMNVVNATIAGERANPNRVDTSPKKIAELAYRQADAVDTEDDKGANPLVTNVSYTPGRNGHEKNGI